MPYIDKDGRSFWDPQIKELADSIVAAKPEVGEMNYIITKLLVAWVKDKLKYVKICNVMGTLVCVMFEFYRRIAIPYENKKSDLNGDVYEGLDK